MTNLPAIDGRPMSRLKKKLTLVEKPENPIPTVQLDLILTSAVVVNWDALILLPHAARIRIEYHIGMDGAVEYLKLWMSARGVLEPDLRLFDPSRLVRWPALFEWIPLAHSGSAASVDHDEPETVWPRL